MKRLFLLLPVLLLIAAKPAPPNPGGWKQFDTNLSRWTSSSAVGIGGDVATCQISDVWANYTAFLVTNLTVNILNKTITATFMVEPTFGDPGYVYGGWQIYPGGISSARLYFSRHSDYTIKGYKADRSGYWFALNWTQVGDLFGTVTIITSVQPANWSESFGGHGDDPQFTPAFNATAQSPVLVGLALGGNNFYDTGVGTTNGSAILHLTSFSVQ